MTRIELRHRVGSDGVLTLTVPVGMAQANREVKVTVEPAEKTAAEAPLDPEQWQQFIRQTAGSIQDPSFRRHEQGEYEDREAID
jgi:hypothetical protein